MNPHLVVGEDGVITFQSDKYPTCPAGKVPLSVQDKSAQDLLWEYSKRRRSVDAEFSDALQQALLANGFVRPKDDALQLEVDLYLGVMGGNLIDMVDATGELSTVRIWDGMDGCWCDVEGATNVRLEEALRVWNEKTCRGTKGVSFKEIDYYKIFPADTKMHYDRDNEMFR